MKNKTVPWFVLPLTALVCLLAGAAAALAGFWWFVGPNNLAYLQAAQTIDRAFVGDYDEKEHRETALNAMVNTLGDRWSYYLTPENYQLLRQQRSNRYVGVGVTVSRELSDGLLITAVTAESPAGEAGIQAGHIIRAVEGVPITPETREDCIAAIRGDEGTQVSLEVEDAQGQRRTVSLPRRTIRTISARWELLEGGVGLVTIDNFYAGTADLVEQGITELTEQGAEALVLDVRNNPGGYVTELTRILDLLLPAGDIFVSRNAQGEERVYTSDEACIQLPLAVLVNSESYSAAEFLAAQLRESAGAIIVGSQTVGKGYSQTLYPLSDGSAMGLSSGKYFTGAGVSLIGTGVEPDLPTELTKEDQALLLAKKLPHEQDLPLQATLGALGYK